ncbi:hypothetical protein THAOC_17473, partial [Thalassiosira oceanica]
RDAEAAALTAPLSFPSRPAAVNSSMLSESFVGETLGPQVVGHQPAASERTGPVQAASVCMSSASASRLRVLKVFPKRGLEIVRNVPRSLASSLS